MYTRQVKWLVLTHTVWHSLLYLHTKFDRNPWTIIKVIARNFQRTFCGRRVRVVTTSTASRNLTLFYSQWNVEIIPNVGKDTGIRGRWALGNYVCSRKILENIWKQNIGEKHLHCSSAGRFCRIFHRCCRCRRHCCCCWVELIPMSENVFYAGYHDTVITSHVGWWA